MTATVSLTRAHLIATTMSHRIAPCRRHFSTTINRHGSERRTRSFVKHIDEHGEVFYTIARKEEGKDLPQIKDLFEMPDLVLDLDAAGINQVREYGRKDEKLLKDKWNNETRHKAAKSSISRMSSQVAQSRIKVLEMNANKTHPMHITDYDITSAALRGLAIGVEERKELFHDSKPEAQQNTSEAENTAKQREPGQTDQPEKLVVTAFSQLDLRDRDGIPTATTHAAQNLVQSSTSASGMRSVIEEGDPRKRPDYMRQLRADNGIPSYAAKNDEQLIRWMMLRRHNVDYVRATQEHAPLSQADVVEAIKSSPYGHVMRRNAFLIRRIIFQSLASGVDFRVVKDGKASRATNIPLAIRDSLAQIFDRFADNYAPHFSVLTLVNNLAERLPDKDGDMDAALFSLRLRALAGMGLVELAAAQLEQGVTPEMWNSGVDVGSDVSAAMLSWNLNLQHNPVLQTQDGRRGLFRILTGFGDTGVAMSTSLRSLILDPRSHRGQKNPNIARLTHFGQYIELLGSLKAVRTLWKEWIPVSRLFRTAQKEDPAQGDALKSYICGCFHKSLLEIVKTADLSGTSADQEPSLEDCAAMDWSSIRSQAPSVNPGEAEVDAREAVAAEATGDRTSLLTVVKRTEFIKMMDLPLEEWLKRVKRWS